MKSIKIRIVDSISEGVEQTQNRIRVRAYEKFLSRGGEAGRALNDWLDAERELILVLTADIGQEEDQLVAEIEIPRVDVKNLLIQVTAKEALVEAAMPGSSETESSQDIALSAFAVI